jgi:hypothetical protein
MFTARFSFDFIELETTQIWALKYFCLPIFIVMVSCNYYIYFQFEQKYYENQVFKSKTRILLKRIITIFAYSFILTVLFTITTFSSIILTNKYFGDNKTVVINAKIIDSYSTSSKIGKTYHIIIKDQKINRLVDLKVDKKYQIGIRFNKTMKIGKWGLLYSEK